MRSRGVASTVVGVALALLIALASVVAGWAVWERASERKRADDDRAALAVAEALSSSVGRSLAIMRASAGLVEPDGDVDVGTFFAFARGVTLVGAANAVALQRVVTRGERARFEAEERRAIVQLVRPGVYRLAPESDRYVAVVAIWPDTRANRELLGLDLFSEPLRRRALEAARRKRDTALTSFLPLANGRQGFVAYQPLYAPGRSASGPTAYVSAAFRADAIADLLGRLPSDFRVRVSAGDAKVFESGSAPGGGTTRTLSLAGTSWVIMAEGRQASRLEPLAIALIGCALALLLAAFAVSRASSERRLLWANQAERRARDRAELLGRDAAFLASIGEVLEQSTTVDGRARRLVEALVEGGADFAAIHLCEEEDGAVELAAAAGPRPAELEDDAAWSERVRQAVATTQVLSLPAADGEPPGEDAGLRLLSLRARGRALGALTISSGSRDGDVPVLALGLAREITSRAALALDNAVLYERERGVSHALQLGLLGRRPPAFEGLAVSASYRPGAAALEVGGDWYDAFLLLDGTIALAVGDVVGHGLGAAVVMGQMRGAVRALGRAGGGPARVLEELDLFVDTVPEASGATVVYAELDPSDGRLRYACAGHPPPLVASPDGAARFLWEGRSAPLGSLLGEERSESSDRLDDGETLVLYTDGLVERRHASLDSGLDRLVGEATLRAHGTERLADELAEALLDGEPPADDVCLLTARRPVGVPLFSHSFRARPAELATLRRRLGAWLDENRVGLDAHRSTVLAVSEAAANAVEHAYASDGEGIVTVMARVEDAELALSVRDRGGWRPSGGNGERGRGLPIMQAIVDDVSIERADGGTVVRMRRAKGDSVET